MSGKMIFWVELAKTLIEEQEAAMAIIGYISIVMILIVATVIVLIPGYVDKIVTYIGIRRNKKLTRERYITDKLLMDENEESVKETINFCDETLSATNQSCDHLRKVEYDIDDKGESIDDKIKVLERELAELKKLKQLRKRNNI